MSRGIKEMRESATEIPGRRVIQVKGKSRCKGLPEVFGCLGLGEGKWRGTGHCVLSFGFALQKEFWRGMVVKSAQPTGLYT